MKKPRFEFLAKALICYAGREENVLAEDNWFDTLNKMLLQDAPRRTLLRAAATLSGGLLFGDRQSTEAAKNRKRKRKRKRKKDKPQPRPQSCSGGVCAAIPQWAGDDNEIAFCEFVCEQCPRNNPQRFCILGGQVADCCDEGLTCCGDICVNTFDDDNHCGSCNHRCSPGKVCFGGDCLCQNGLTLCGDICRDTDRDENNCGGCNQPCTGGWVCCDGDCKDSDRDEEHCGGCGQTCIGPDLQCCGGDCVNTRTDPEHCGACYRGEAGFRCCGGHVYDPTLQFCCPDELRPCFNDQLCCTRNDGTPACCPRP
jgi:hypothetical protein